MFLWWNYMYFAKLNNFLFYFVAFCHYLSFWHQFSVRACLGLPFYSSGWIDSLFSGCFFLTQKRSCTFTATGGWNKIIINICTLQRCMFVWRNSAETDGKIQLIPQLVCRSLREQLSGSWNICCIVRFLFNPVLATLKMIEEDSFYICDSDCFILI